MAVSTGYDYGIKSALVGKGVDPSHIGYDPGRGYVTVGGKDFMKADKVYNGSSFTNQQRFDNAWNTYNSAATPSVAGSPGAGSSVSNPSSRSATNTPTSTIGQYGITNQATPGAVNRPSPVSMAGISTTPAATPAPTPSPMDVYNQHFQTIDQLMNQQVDPNAIYASPEYAAYQAQAAKQAQAATRQAQEAYGASGFGRSYALGERAQGIQNDANAYLDTQVLPQLLAQARAEQQQKIQNEYGLLDQAWNQINRGDTLEQNAQTNAINKGNLLGVYESPEMQAAYNDVLQAKQDYALAKTPEERAAAHNRAEQARAKLTGLNANAGLVGGDVTYDQAISNQPNYGVKTQAAKEFDQNQSYQQGRDKVKDSQFDKTFNANEDQRNKDNQFRTDQFDRAKYESDRDYRLKVQQQSIDNGQWQQQFNLDVEKFGFQKASELWSQAFQMDQANQDNSYRLSQADREAANQATNNIAKSGLISITEDPSTGQQTFTVPDQDALSNYIISLNLSDDATDSLLYQYGLGSYVKK